MTKARDLANGGFGLVLMKPSTVVNGTDNGKGTISFTTASSVSLNGVFTSTYKNYRLIFNLKANAASLIRCRFRASGSDNSTSNYYFTSQQINGASWTDLGNANADTTAVIFYNDTNESNTSMDVYTPQTVNRTSYASSGHYGRLGTYAAGVFDTTAQFDGITFFPTGTITGTVSVYGYKN